MDGALAGLWGVGPGQEKDKSRGRKAWENDSRKEARITETERQRQMGERGRKESQKSF